MLIPIRNHALLSKIRNLLKKPSSYSVEVIDMKPEKLFELIGEADENFVNEAAEYPRKARSGGLFMRLAAAACLVTVLGVSAWFAMQTGQGSLAGDIGIPPEPPVMSIHEGTLLVADFLGDFTSLFGFGVLTVVEDTGFEDFVDFRNRPFTEHRPLIRFDGELFWDNHGTIFDSAPFLRDGNLVATSFVLNDLCGTGVPIITIFYSEVGHDGFVWFPAEHHWEMFQYVNGDFVRVVFDRELNSSPVFFRDSVYGLVMLSGTDDDPWDYSRFSRVALNNGELETIEVLPDDFSLRAGWSAGTRMYELENSIINLMEQRFRTTVAPYWGGSIPSHSPELFVVDGYLSQPDLPLGIPPNPVVIDGYLPPLYDHEGFPIVWENPVFADIEEIMHSAEFERNLERSIESQLIMHNGIDRANVNLIYAMVMRIAGESYPPPPAAYVTVTVSEEISETMGRDIAILVARNVRFLEISNVHIRDQYQRVVWAGEEYNGNELLWPQLQQERHTPPQAGAIVIDGDRLYLDKVEVVWLDSPVNGEFWQFIQNENPETIQLEITDETQFGIVENGEERLITFDFIEFLRHIYPEFTEYRSFVPPIPEIDVNYIGTTTYGRLIYWVAFDINNRVTHVTMRTLG